MKSFFLLLILGASAYGQSSYPPGYKPILRNRFGGLNIHDDSIMIGGDAQTAQNVLTDSGYLEKRPGNVRLTTILAGFAGTYGDDWVAPNGTRYLIAQSSNTVYQTNFSTNPVALSTITAGYNLSAAKQFSTIFFADGFRVLWFWNGTSTGTVTDLFPAQGGTHLAPVCTYIAAKDARLWCANLPNGYQDTPGNKSPGGGTSTVWISSVNGAGWWDVPSNVASVDNAPNRFDLNPDDGDSITCMAPTPWGMYVGKRNSSYVIKGTGNLTYYVRIIDPKIGCVDNRSIQMVNGVMVWLAVDGVYAWTGAGPFQLLSHDIDPLILSARGSTFSQGQWATQLYADWATGSVSNNGPTGAWDFSSVHGQIFPSSATFQDVLANQFSAASLSVGFTTNSVSSDILARLGFGGVTPIQTSSGSFVNAGAESNSTTINWTAITPSAGMVWQTDTTANSQYGTYAWRTQNHSAGISQKEILYVMDTSSNVLASASLTFNGGGCPISMQQQYIDLSTFTVSQIVLRAVSQASSGAGCSPTLRGQVPPTYGDDTSGGCRADMYSAPFNRPRALAVKFGALGPLCAELYSTFDVDESTLTLNGTLISREFDTQMSTPLYGGATIVMSSSPGAALTFQMSVASVTGGTYDAWVNASTTAFASAAKRAVRYKVAYTLSSTTNSFTFNSLTQPAVSTGNYYSQVQFIGSLITSWRQFSVTENNPGTYNYYVRVASYSFPASNTAITWSTQTANQNVSVATNTYAQFRLDSSSVTFAQVEPISAVFLRWNQGTNLPVASATMERRYHLCVTISTSATAPDVCLVRQKNGKWVTWTGPSVGAMGYYNNQMIAVDGSTNSRVWSIMQPNVYMDDGEPINAIWTSGDEVGGSTFNQKKYYGTWFDAMPVQGSSVTFSYQVNKSSGFVSKQFSLDNGKPLDLTKSITGTQYGSLNQWAPASFIYDTGKYIRVQFSDNQLNDYFRINEYVIMVQEQPMVFSQ